MPIVNIFKKINTKIATSNLKNNGCFKCRQYKWMTIYHGWPINYFTSWNSISRKISPWTDWPVVWLLFEVSCGLVFSSRCNNVFGSRWETSPTRRLHTVSAGDGSSKSKCKNKKAKPVYLFFKHVEVIDYNADEEIKSEKRSAYNEYHKIYVSVQVRLVLGLQVYSTGVHGVGHHFHPAFERSLKTYDL